MKHKHLTTENAENTEAMNNKGSAPQSDSFSRVLRVFRGHLVPPSRMGKLAVAATRDHGNSTAKDR